MWVQNKCPHNEYHLRVICDKGEECRILGVTKVSTGVLTVGGGGPGYDPTTRTMSRGARRNTKEANKQPEEVLGRGSYSWC